MPSVKNIVRQWLPLALVITAICALVYVSVQQSLRMSANDPQIQMAEDAANALTAGAAPDAQLPSTSIAIETSLAPFMTILDDSGQPVASSGLLHGQMPKLPSGVLDYVREHGEDRVTWQPAPGVRVAAVIVRARGARQGFVLAGRSLREIEQREWQAELEAGAAWLLTMIASLAAVTMTSLVLGHAYRGN